MLRKRKRKRVTSSPTSSTHDQVLAGDHSPTHVSHAAEILSYVILVGGLGTIGMSAYMVAVSYSALPYWDGWTQIEYAHQPHPALWDWLWAQHNEHRLLIPNLFLLTDLRWFGARQEFLLISIFGVQLLHLLLLSWSMHVLGGWHGAVWRTGTGLAAFCLFCPSQWENLVWGFQTCFVLPGLFATLSFIGLVLYWTRSRAKYLVLCIAAALGATYSLSSGNLLGPLLVLAAVLLRLRLAALVTLVVAGTISASVYLYDYVPTHAMSTRPTLGRALQYLAVYFGSAWVPSSVPLAELIGIVGLASTLFLLFWLRRYVKVRRPFSVELALTLLFCVGTALITAMARAGFGLSHAFTSRYQTVSLLFWCCLGLVLLSLSAPTGRGREVVLFSTQLTLLAIMAVAAKSSQTPVIRARVHGFQQNAAAAALVVGMPDFGQLRWVSPDPDNVLALAPSMREQHLSVFSGREPRWLGKPLDSTFTVVSPGGCTGRIETSTAVTDTGPRSLRITGWAWDYRDRPPSEIVITTNGIINGLGAVGDWRPGKLGSSWAANFTGYTGYVRDVQESSLVQVYAVLRDKRSACYLAMLGPGDR